MTSTNERDSHFFLAGWNGAWRNVNASEHFQNVSKTAPAAVAVRDALLQSEAALEVATARILKSDPGHSISVTSEAKALVAVRAAIAATPAASKETGEAESEVWPCVNIDVDDAGNVTNAKLYSPGLPAGNHDVYPVRVPYMDEHTEAWKACHAELWKLVPDFMRNSQLNGLDSAVAAIRHLAITPAAAAPVLPEPDKQVKELMVLIGKYGSAVEANSTGNPSNYTLASDESAAYEAIKAKLRALLATATGLPAHVCKDSTPQLHVGDSSFEGWYAGYVKEGTVSLKQNCRDAYAAGMGDPLVVAAPHQAALNRDARNQLAQLTTQLEAIGAGGVESLRKK